MRHFPPIIGIDCQIVKIINILHHNLLIYLQVALGLNKPVMVENMRKNMIKYKDNKIK
jgi:hypothetical protein